MKQIIKLDMRLITIILTLLQFKIDVGQSYSYNDRQSHFWGHVNSNNNHDVVQQNSQTKKHHHHHHQEFKDHGNSIGRWAQQPGRGCFWTGCMSKLHQYYCPAATFAHEVNPCPSLALHVDVMCCLSRPQEVTQPKIVHRTYPPTTTPATTATTETPPLTTTPTTTTTPPITTTTTEPPPTTGARHHNHHQSKSKGHGNSFGRWAHQPGRGCFWTGCMSKLHRHYCPAATFVHEVNPCPSPALHVDVMCCLSWPQKATQSKMFDIYLPTTTSTTETPPPTTATTTVKTTTTSQTTTTTETPPITTTEPTMTTITETPPTTTTEHPTTINTDTPPTTATTTETPPTTATEMISSEAPPTIPDYVYEIVVTPKFFRK